MGSLGGSLCSKHENKISAGWTTFALGNPTLRMGTCALELVGPIHELHVHIFRLVEDTKPLIEV